MVDVLTRALARKVGWRVNEGTEFERVVGIFALNPVEELSHQLATSNCKALFTATSLLQVALKAAKTKGKLLLGLEPIKWSKRQGARQTAFLCYSSGTSGLPRAVTMSNFNVIANIVQLPLFNQQDRNNLALRYRDLGLGLLPQSHFYSWIIICHELTYSEDSVIVLRKFKLDTYLRSVEEYRINTLYPVLPIFSEARMGWCCAFWLGSNGDTLVCIPGLESYAAVMLGDTDGRDITSYNQPGEVLVKSPSIVLGCLNNEKANQETFAELPQGRFGNEHQWIVDRIQELIKNKGHQVVPAELEPCLLKHPSVADCAVIPVPDGRAGEVPKAFVFRPGTCPSEEVQRYVHDQISSHKWIKGSIEFVDSISKSPSGRILRRFKRPGKGAGNGQVVELLSIKILGNLR
ncbi:acetyl-CoA synthetase-like protein [Zopfia rhizophila CBS 207.26]|uniref:Acetyl-CoA synthetase-like protein n=1 Tax=Zopfia rhizophila CBS 207.26 TaxID=1314779 RepID=A0A6A6EMK1_9PEZI|nr:acetyl-CoA synthetase-like protein [Zopfia rhizophila CBS 207.26]